MTKDFNITVKRERGDYTLAGFAHPHHAGIFAKQLSRGEQGTVFMVLRLHGLDQHKELQSAYLNGRSVTGDAFERIEY